MACNPLSNPKGVKLRCELCSKPAFLFCEKCRVTYYCDTEHQNIDWLGIHEKICQLLIPLRTTISLTSGSEEERKHRQQQQLIRQKQMIELTWNAGQRCLYEEKYEYAIPAALQSLKFSIAVYGASSIQLAPAYLLLGEACIGLSRLNQAAEYLSQAQWTVLKTDDCSNDIKSRLHRNFGLLRTAQENYDEALYHLSEDIYYSSFGAEDLRTSRGYYHMANIFFKQNKLDVAFSIYNYLTTLWHDHLQKLVMEITSDEKQISVIGPAELTEEKSPNFSLDEAQSAGGMQTLNAILKLRQSQNSTGALTSKTLYTLAMLYLVLGNYTQAELYTNRALTALKEGSTEREVVQEFKQKVTKLQKQSPAQV